MKTSTESKNKTITYIREGVQVKDSRTGLTVKVTSVDIDKAICSDHQKCVIARALKREMAAKWVDVGAEIVLIGVSNKLAKRYRLSKVAREQVRYFDTHKGRYAPCNVQLLAVSPCKRLGKMSRGPKQHVSRGLRLKKRRPTR